MPDLNGVCDWLSPVYSSGMSIMTPDRVSQLNQRLAVSGTIASFYFARILKIYRPRISHKIALHRKPESESLPLKMASIPREWSICARTYYTKCPHTYMNSKIEDIHIYIYTGCSFENFTFDVEKYALAWKLPRDEKREA